MDKDNQAILSQADESFALMMQVLTDEAKDGPRLFSLLPVEAGFWNVKTWVSQKFRLTLWCEHARLPLPTLNGPGDRQRGVYELAMPREWFVKAAPFFRGMIGVLRGVLPAASVAAARRRSAAARRRAR